MEASILSSKPGGQTSHFAKPRWCNNLGWRRHCTWLVGSEFKLQSQNSIWRFTMWAATASQWDEIWFWYAARSNPIQTLGPIASSPPAVPSLCRELRAQLEGVGASGVKTPPHGTSGLGGLTIQWSKESWHPIASGKNGTKKKLPQETGDKHGIFSNVSLEGGHLRACCLKLGWNQPPWRLLHCFLPAVMQRQLNGATEAATKLFTICEMAANSKIAFYEIITESD